MAQKIERKDLQFSYFRLKDQKVNEDPKGVMVMHLPSGNTALSDGPVFLDNRNIAVERLYQKMGVPVEQWKHVNNCVTCGHRLVSALAGWDIDYTYRLRVGDVLTLVVYEATTGEGWYWEASIDEAEDYEGDLYETAEGAAKAAHDWASSYTRIKKDDKVEDNGE